MIDSGSRIEIKLCIFPASAEIGVFVSVDPGGDCIRLYIFDRSLVAGAPSSPFNGASLLTVSKTAHFVRRDAR